MKDHISKAQDLFQSGCNCAQSVLTAFCDETGLTPEMSLKLGLPFGGGMANTRGTCGAVIGMVMVLGAKYGFSEIDNEKKRSFHKTIRDSQAQFQMKSKSLICGEILASNPGHDHCQHLVTLAAEIIDKAVQPKK